MDEMTAVLQTMPRPLRWIHLVLAPVFIATMAVQVLTEPGAANSYASSAHDVVGMLLLVWATVFLGFAVRRARSKRANEP